VADVPFFCFAGTLGRSAPRVSCAAPQKRIGEAVVAHATTNALIAVYVPLSNAGTSASGSARTSPRDMLVSAS